MKLVLLLYVSRSGSTLFANQVARHFEQVLVIPELRLPALLARQDVAASADPRATLLELVAQDHQFPVLELPPGEVEACIDRLGDTIDAEGFLGEIARAVAARRQVEPEVVVFKCGAAAGRHAEDLRKIMPTIGLVHIYRDPRAAVNSAMRTPRPYHPGETMGRGDPWLQAERWAAYIERMRELDAQGQLLLQVKFEDLCTDPGAALRAFGAALQLQQGAARGAGLSLSGQEAAIHENADKDAMPERADAWQREMPTWQGLVVEQLTAAPRRELGYDDYFHARGGAFTGWLLRYGELRHRLAVKRYRRRRRRRLRQPRAPGEPPRILFISNKDPRKRYRFLLEPLREIGAEVELFDGAGAMRSAVPRLVNRLLRGPRVDVLVMTGGNTSNLVWFLLTSLLTRAKTVLRFGGHPLEVRSSVEQRLKVRDNWKTALRAWFGRSKTEFLLRKVAAIIVVSDFLLGEMRADIGDGVRTLVLPPTLKRPQGSLDVDREARTGDAVKLLTVTNLKYREKADGVITIARAVEQLAKTGDVPVVYDVLGGGDQLDYLQRELEAAGLLEDGRVVLHGRRDNVNDFYREADVFAYCSTLDGYPLVLCEAQSWGLPIVANHWGAFPAMLNADRDALFFDDDAGLQAALQRLVADPQLRARMSEAANRNFTERHSSVECGRRLHQFLQSLL